MEGWQPKWGSSCANILLQALLMFSLMGNHSSTLPSTCFWFLSGPAAVAVFSCIQNKDLAHMPALSDGIHFRFCPLSFASLSLSWQAFHLWFSSSTRWTVIVSFGTWKKKCSLTLECPWCCLFLSRDIRKSIGTNVKKGHSRGENKQHRRRF